MNRHQNYISLYRNIKHLLRFYQLPQQVKVYENLLAESKTLARHYRAYQTLNKIKLGYLVLCFYGFRVAGRYDVHTKTSNPLVALSIMPNHISNMKYINELSNDEMNPFYIGDEGDRFYRLKNIMRFALQIFNKGSLKSLLQALRIVKKIDKRYGWIEAINIAQFLFCVFSFKNIFSDDNKLCFTANDFSALPLAFKHTGSAAGLKQIFVMHGQISSTESGNLFPRLDYDLSFLYGHKALEVYKTSGEPKGDVVLTGFPGTSLAIRKIKGDTNKVGICLANYFDNRTYKQIVLIASLYPNANIYLRCHPRTEHLPNFDNKTNIFISEHSNIADFAKDCDFVIAGNTGAQIDLLKFGCPIIHDHKLDQLGIDDIGLVKDKLVLMFDENNILNVKDINEFYDTTWAKRFKDYDHLYLADEKELTSVRKQVIQAYRALL